MLTFHTAHSKFKTFEKQFDEKISYLRKDHPDLKYGTVSKATRDEMIKKLNEEKSKQFEDRQVGEKISPFVDEYFPDKQSKQSKKDSQTTAPLIITPEAEPPGGPNLITISLRLRPTMTMEPDSTLKLCKLSIQETTTS